MDYAACRRIGSYMLTPAGVVTFGLAWYAINLGIASEWLLAIAFILLISGQSIYWMGALATNFEHLERSTMFRRLFRRHNEDQPVDLGREFEKAAIAAEQRGDHGNASVMWGRAAEHSADDHAAMRRSAQSQRCRAKLAKSVAAFTLMEVLIALAIFAVGAVAVAAIFPSAIVLQRSTIQQVQANQAGGGAEAAILARGFDVVDAWWAALPTNEVAPLLPNIEPTAPMWTISDRGVATDGPNAATQDTYWVPLALKIGTGLTVVETAGGLSPNPPFPVITPPNLKIAHRSSEQMKFPFVYYFVLHRDANETYPKPPLGGGAAWANPTDPDTVPGVRSITGVTVGNGVDGERRRFSFPNPDLVRVGDKILDNGGGIYTVTTIALDSTWVDVDRAIRNVAFTSTLPDTLWVAPRGSCRGIWSILVTPENRLVH